MRQNQNKLFAGCGVVAAMWVMTIAASSDAYGQDRLRFEDAELFSPAPSVHDQTGSHLAIAGDWIFVSAELSSIGALSAGAVIPFRRTAQGYLRHSPIVAPVPLQSEFLSRYGVHASGKTLAIGSWVYPDQFNPTGRVLMYEFDPVLGAWQFTESFEPGTGFGPNRVHFARSMELDGDLMVVGAPGLGAPLPGGQPAERGGFFSYKRTNGIWVLEQVWQAPSTFVVFAGVGLNMALDGNTLVTRGASWNRVFIFDRDPTSGQWTMVQELVNPVPFIVDEDSLAMDVEGDTLVLGAEHNDYQALGRVVTYRRVAGQWVFESELRASDSGNFGDGFGVSVALKNNRLLVGARGARDAAGRRRGAAYLYERGPAGDWIEVHKLIKGQAAVGNELLGEAVALGDNVAVLGDRLHTGSVTVQGGAFAYDLPMGDQTCDGVSNSTGTPAWLEVLGSHRADAGFVRLRAGNLPQGLAGLFLGSQQSGFLPNPGGSQGILCLSGSILRFNQSGQFGQPQSDGTFELQMDTSNLPFTPGVPILAGQTWNFQMWYRDLIPNQATNFTSSVEVLFD